MLQSQHCFSLAESHDVRVTFNPLGQNKKESYKQLPIFGAIANMLQSKRVIVRGWATGEIQRNETESVSTVKIKPIIPLNLPILRHSKNATLKDDQVSHHGTECQHKWMC